MRFFRKYQIQITDLIQTRIFPKLCLKLIFKSPKIVSKNKKAYSYLGESIDLFPNQNELKFKLILFEKSLYLHLLETLK